MKIYTRRQLMMEEARVKPYISDGLVFHLDGADATDTTWVDRVAGVIFTLTGATPNGKGVVFNTTRKNDVAVPNSIPTSISSVNGNNGTIEVCAYRSISAATECLYTTNRYSIQYVVDGDHIALSSSNATASYSPRAPLPNGREIGLFMHSCNANINCYNGMAVTPGSKTYKTMYDYRVGNNAARAIPFRGTIYQIRIYNRQLSLEEMRFNQEQDRKRYGIQF